MKSAYILVFVCSVYGLIMQIFVLVHTGKRKFTKFFFELGREPLYIVGQTQIKVFKNFDEKVSDNFVA